MYRILTAYTFARRNDPISGDSRCYIVIKPISPSFFISIRLILLPFPFPFKLPDCTKNDQFVQPI